MCISNDNNEMFVIKVFFFFQGPPSKPARRQGGWAEESSGSGSAKYVSVAYPPSSATVATLKAGTASSGLGLCVINELSCC